MYLKWISEDLC